MYLIYNKKKTMYEKKKKDYNTIKYKIVNY